MKGLLVKDFCLLRELKKMILIVVFVSVVFTATKTDTAFLTGYIVILSAMIAGMTISYDEMNGGLAFLMTLPVTRKQYVAEKYLAGLLILAAGVLYAAVMAMVQKLVNAESISWKETILTIAICAVVGVIMLSFSIPADLKFGAEKGRIMLIFGFMLTFFVIFFGLRFLESHDPERMDALMHCVNHVLAGTWIYPVCLFAGVLVLLISLILSCRILEKKEF